MIVVLMGVAGTGKTTVGRVLAAELGWEFRDADDFHPAANIAKMSRGEPLTDADRAPWLAAIRLQIEACLDRGGSAVFTCSALRESYRQAILADPARVKLVQLSGSADLIRQRLAGRSGHFMKPDMLASQLASLEPPADVLTIDVAPPPEVIAGRIRSALSL
jgi:gluconokinase